MKKQIFFTIFATLSLLASIISPAYAALDPLPPAAAPFSIRDRYQTDVFTGTASYAYPIKVPKGTDDLTPDASLTYNSGGARDFVQPAGMGWQINQDYIERDVNFTPGNIGDDKFKLHFKGGVYDLVDVAADSLFHTKTESHLKIQQFLSGGQNTTGRYWQVTTQDGTIYRFGYSSNAQLMCNGRNYDYLWNLDQVQDTHNNHIYYSYTQNAGASYLSQIKYNNDQSREVNFTYGTHPLQRQVYAQGCNVTFTQILNNIQVKVGTSVIRQYDINYATAGNNQPVLQAITEKGSDGSALPPTTFEYKSEIKNWANTAATWVNNAPMDVHLMKTDVQMADVNGDGLLDIVKSEGNGTNTWKVWKNTGSSWNTTYETWLNNAPIDAKLDRTDTDLMDVTGDGLPDIIKTNGGGPWKVYRNLGNSWNPNGEVWADFSIDEINLDTNRIKLVDVTGDGLPDIVRTWWNAHQEWQVYRNLGNSWSTTAEVWAYGAIDEQGLDTPTIRLIDVNGDNLPDIVKAAVNGTNNTWHVMKNTGGYWNMTRETWLNNAPVDAHFGMINVVVTDANGDGLADIVKSQEGPNRWSVLRNLGNSWSATWEEWVNPAGPVLASLQQNTQMADITGDSLPDIIRTTTGTGPNVTWEVYKNNGLAPDLLSAVHTAQGGTITFDYKQSTSFDNTGADSIPDLPFNLWLVQKKTENNGMTNTHQTNDITTYFYQDGFYKWQDREFRGFGTIDENLPNGTKKKYVFHQDDLLKGMLAELQIRDNQDNPYTETENTWGTSTTNNVNTINLTQEKNYTYDGNATNPKITQTDYLYDNYGNITKKSEQGDTAITGDERFTYFEYTTNPTLWIINTLKHTYKNKSDDSTKINESWLYYDGNLSANDAPTKGDVTKEVKWLSGGTNPTTQYDYDSFGNQTSITDANNRTTQIAYDATKTYPISTTNAKNQTTTMSYDLGTGNLLSKTDPNNNTTSYTYDVFGRISKEIKPYDNSTYPTTSYTYFDSTSAPQGVRVSKRETSGTAETLDAYTYIDGLGRKIQTRTDAEDTAKQIVTDTFYDPTGQVLKQTVPYLTILSSTYTTPTLGIKTTEMTYDPLARTTIIKNPKGDSKTVAYDHWKVTNIDENGHIKRNYFNAYNKITKVDEVNGGLSYSTNYEYDAQDNLTIITDSSANVTSTTYDTLGRKVSQIDPDLGAWSYTYDGVDNLLTRTDARGITTTTTYDELNRVKEIDYPTDTDTIFTYDTGKIGVLSSVTDTAGLVNYTYDNRLRKTQEARSINGTTKTTQFEYDAADRITKQTNPDGTLADYTFNNQGEINSLTGVVNNIDYNALSKITKKDFANNVSTNYTYNTDDFRLNKIQTLRQAQGEPVFFDKNYTYDAVGNIASITNALTSKTETFSYDDLDRLTSATETNGYNYTYEYNPLGNLTKFIDNGTPIDYTYGQNAGPHALTGSTAVPVVPTPSPTPTPPAGTTVTSQVGASNGDAEEDAAGTIDLTSTDLELTCDTTTNPCPSNDVNKQTIGMRFGSLAVPQSATITSAYIEFTADEAQSESTNITLNGQATDNASTFTTSTNNISSRTKTTASVTWSSLPAWTIGTKYQTPDLSSVIQEIVNRGGWASGNAAGIIITGLGHRTAHAFDGNSSNAPKLVVTYTTGPTATPTPTPTTTPAAITVSNLTTDSDADGGSTSTTTSIAPTANKLLLLSVANRTEISTNPNQPTVTGSGLTWIAVRSTLFDSTSSSRRRITLFRAMGASPTNGALTIDFAGQNQTNVAWTLDQATGIDTSGTNGSGAIVQSASANNESGTATSLTVTLAAFASSSNATYGTFGDDGNTTPTAGSGFSILSAAESGTDLSVTSEFKNTNDTSVDMTLAPAGVLGGIAVELKPEAESTPTPTPTPTAGPTATPTPTPTPTPPGGIVSGQIYRLVNQCSNKVLDVLYAGTTNSVNVDQWTWSGATNQQWKIETTTGIYYKITAQHSNKVLDVDSASTSDGANVMQYTWSGGTNQEWSITDVGGGYYKILARHSGKALDVSGGSTASGANVQQWTDNGSCAQKWKIETF